MSKASEMADKARYTIKSPSGSTEVRWEFGKNISDPTFEEFCEQLLKEQREICAKAAHLKNKEGSNFTEFEVDIDAIREAEKPPIKYD